MPLEENMPPPKKKRIDVKRQLQALTQKNCSDRLMDCCEVNNKKLTLNRRVDVFSVIALYC